MDVVCPMWGYFKNSPGITGVLDAIFSDDRILIVCLKQRRFRDKHRGFSEPGDGSLDWRSVPVVRPDEFPSLPVDKRPHELYLSTTERTSWIPASLHCGDCRCEMWCLRLWAWMPCRTLVPQLLVPCAWQTWGYEGLQTWHWRERESVRGKNKLPICCLLLKASVANFKSFGHCSFVFWESTCR